MQELRENFPREVQLPGLISWKIAASAFRDSPLTGTEPSTFLYNFTNYKPAEFNQLQYWSVPFSSPYNEFLQALSSWGLLGLLSLAALCTAMIISSKKVLFSGIQDESVEESGIFLPALAVSGFVSVILLLVHVTTLVFVVSTLFLMAVFMTSRKNIREKITELSLGIKVSAVRGNYLDLLPIFALVLYVIAAIPAGKYPL